MREEIHKAVPKRYKIPQQDKVPGLWILYTGACHYVHTRGATVWCCNSALTKLENPDYYHVTDPFAKEDFAWLRILAQNDYGTKVISNDDTGDIHIRYDRTTSAIYKRGGYTPARNSGVLGLQWILGQGAEIVHIRGMRGWRSTELKWERNGVKHDRTGMNELAALVMAQIIRQWPETTFVWHGESIIRDYVKALGNYPNLRSRK